MAQAILGRGLQRAVHICDLADKLSTIHIRPKIEGSGNLNKVLEIAEIYMWTDTVNVLGCKSTRGKPVYSGKGINLVAMGVRGRLMEAG